MSPALAGRFSTTVPPGKPRLVILTVLILPIHGHGLFFYLFVLPSIFFINVLQFSEYRFFTFLIRFIPRYFIPFDTMVNGIVFLISLSDSVLLVYRNAIDFCILILCLVTLLDLLKNSSSFLVMSLGLSMHSICIMSSANGDSFTSSFPICIPFISFSSNCRG